MTSWKALLLTSEKVLFQKKVNCTKEKNMPDKSKHVYPPTHLIPISTSSSCQPTPTSPGVDVLKVSSCSKYYEGTVSSNVLETKGCEEFMFWRWGGFTSASLVKNPRNMPGLKHVVWSRKQYEIIPHSNDEYFMGKTENILNVLHDPPLNYKW